MNKLKYDDQTMLIQTVCICILVENFMCILISICLFNIYRHTQFFIYMCLYIYIYIFSLECDENDELERQNDDGSLFSKKF